MNKTLLDKAYANLIYAKSGFLRADDEIVFDLVGYHVQQAVESTIKYVLEMNGVEYAHNHNIRQMIQLSESKNVDLKLPEFIYEHAEMFTEWEASSRYVMNFKLELKWAKAGYKAAAEYYRDVVLEYEPEKYRDDIFLDEKEKNDQ